jgi:hypothetical protein
MSSPPHFPTSSRPYPSSSTSSTMTNPTVTARHAEWCRYNIPTRLKPVERESFDPNPSYYPFQNLPSDRRPLSPAPCLCTPLAFPLPIFHSSPLCSGPCSLHCRIPFLRCTPIINNNSSSRSSSNNSNGILQTHEPSLPRIHPLSVAKEGMIRRMLRIIRGIINMPTTSNSSNNNSRGRIVLCLITVNTIHP